MLKEVRLRKEGYESKYEVKKGRQERERDEMMSLCRTLLGFADAAERCRRNPSRRRCGAAPSDAAGLRCVAAEILGPPPHIVESVAVGPRSPLSTLPQEEEERPVERIDDGTRGLSYLYGRGGGGRLELCTESLGFESCCDGRMGAEEERAEQEIRRRIDEANNGRRGDGAARRRARLARRRAERKDFPPPLTWLSGGDGGRCRSFLKAVRKDGRFLLSEVRIERPEVLRATRQGGRLRLELVEPEPEATEEEEEMAAEVEKAVLQKAPRMEQRETMAGEEEEVVEEEEELTWRLPAANALERRAEGGGGGFRNWRCQELAREGLPSSPFWGSQFVTTA